MNYGKQTHICFLETHRSILSSRAGVPEKYCADIERKIHGAIAVDTDSTNKSPAVH